MSLTKVMASPADNDVSNWNRMRLDVKDAYDVITSLSLSLFLFLSPDLMAIFFRSTCDSFKISAGT